VRAGGRGHLRASHADREQVIGALTAAFVQGMLIKDEFDLRVGQTFASRTYADLAALTADIPARVAATRPLRTSAQAGARVPGKAADAAACVGLALVLLAVAALMGPGDFPERLIVLAVFFSFLCAACQRVGYCCSTRGLKARSRAAAAGATFRHGYSGIPACGPGHQARDRRHKSGRLHRIRPMPHSAAFPAPARR